MTNLNLLFNKTYYDCLGKGNENEHFEACNKELFGSVLRDSDFKKSPLENEKGFKKFYMQTSYPGMLIGSGYTHGSHLNDSPDDLNMGFSFDYTTGLPYIPGSSVKGVLKSGINDELLSYAFSELFPDLTEIPKAKALIDEIFESGRDIFLDAVLFKGDKYGNFLGDDTLAHHSAPTKNPNPVKFMKIMPEVVFEFRFILSDSASLSAEQKKALFILLLEISGAGAKTNTGYGELKEISEEAAKAIKYAQKTNNYANTNRNQQRYNNRDRNGGYRNNFNRENNYHQNNNSALTGTVKKKNGAFYQVVLQNGFKADVHQNNIENVNAEELIGKTVTLELRMYNDKKRYYIIGVIE